MSKIQHKVLFAAIAMGLSSGAFAAEITKNESTPAAYVHAWELNGNTTAANNTAANAGVIGYSIQSGDNAVLRAQNINVVIKPTGAEFTSLAVSSAQGTAGATAINADGSATFTIAAPSGNLFGTGNLFTISAGDAVLNSVPSAQGGTVSFTVELRDPTTNALIDSASGVVMTVAQASDVKIAANTSPVLIDVGATPARTAFVGGGDVVDLGVVSVGFKDQNPATPAVDVASGLGSAVVANVDGDDLFTYAATSDMIDLTVTAENGAAFRTISPAPTAPGYNGAAGIRYMAAATGPAGTPTVANCAAGSGTLFTGTANNVNEFKATVTLTDDMINHGIRICGEVNGVTEIEAQTFNATAKIDLAAAGTQDPAAVSGALATLRYNGVSIPVDHINPASNPGQQTYLRISNTSGIDGVVRISGRDDAGNASGVVSFLLPRGESIQLTSQDLENGNADKSVSGGFGSGTGKWRATVTADLPANAVKVQNFLRNRTDAGVVNTNVNVEK